MFCYLFRPFLFLLRETSLIQQVKMVIYYFFVCQMFRSHWTVSWTNLLSVFLGALAFDMDYVRWQDDHIKQINELRAALNAHASDDDLRRIINSFMAHYYEAFRLKGVAAKADAIHVPSGMWKTPIERCFYVVRSILTVRDSEGLCSLLTCSYCVMCFYQSWKAFQFFYTVACKTSRTPYWTALTLEGPPRHQDIAIPIFGILTLFNMCYCGCTHHMTAKAIAHEPDIAWISCI